MSYRKEFLQENPECATVITIPEDSETVYIATRDQELVYIMEDFQHRYPVYCVPDRTDAQGRNGYWISPAGMLMVDAVVDVLDRMIYGI